MIAATHGPAAVNAGAQILASGGTAAEAVLAAAITQTVLCAGAWDSFAGILGFLHYEAATSSIASLNAGFNTVLNEHEPLSIPRRGSGRSVLVPGFCAGIQAVHRRFGRLAFSRLFEEAIAFAEDGFPIAGLGSVLRQRRRFLSKSPPQTFVRDGNRLRQPRLANTLCQLARHGAGYMYEGLWAERFVEAVGRRGGRISAADLRDYQPTWVEPVSTTFRDCDVYGAGPPATGGIYIIEALNIVDALGLGSEHYSMHPDSLFWLMQATHARYFHHAPPSKERTEKESAIHLADEIRRHRGLNYLGGFMIRSKASHSDGVVAVDVSGNVAALCHSINTILWGELGLFVDGVSIPDAASHQQSSLARVGPGARLPDAMNPALALRHGRPVFASACTGEALHEVTLQMLLNALLYGMDLENACRTPLFLQPAWTGLFRLTAGIRKPWAPIGARVFDAITNAALCFYPATKPLLNIRQLIPNDGFSPEVVRAIRRQGQPCKVFDTRHAPSFWAGVHLDSSTGAVTGASRPGISAGLQAAAPLYRDAHD